MVIRKRVLCFLAGIPLMLLIGVTEVYGQYQILHQSPAVIEKSDDVRLTFEVPGISATEVQDAFLFYRLDGDLSYQQQRASLNQSEFNVSLDISNQNVTTVEYYFEIQYIDGQSQTYPANISEGEPVRVEVIEERPEQQASGSEKSIDYNILSPEPGEGVAPDDVVIAIALFYEEGAVDSASSFQLYLDGDNITPESDASDYFLTYVPGELILGSHEVMLTLVKGDEEEEIVSWDFSVVDPATLAANELQQRQQTSGNFVPSGTAELSARNQVIAGDNNDALSGNFRLSGRKNDIRYTAYGLVTSQEDPRLQAQNRFGAELYIGNWFEMQAGHIYPTLSPLTIAGQRVQGINAAVRPFDGAVSAQFILGKLRRDISNLYSSIEAQPQVFNGDTVATDFTLGFEGGGFGTFRRDIIGGRLSFGKSNAFQFGLNALKVEDDTTSLNVIRNYTDVQATSPELADSLTFAQRDSLESNPDLLSVNGNPLPKGNFVAGSDLILGFDDNNVQFRADAAVSLLNEDITEGPLDREAADALGFELDQNAENLLDQLSWLIIINENMNALPLRFDVSGDQTNAEFFFPTSIIGTQSELSLNYFKNSFRLKYRWVGPEFNSLANSTVRKDIAGITVSDRFRLLQNRIYVTLGYENLDDNVVGSKDATTNTNTLRGNVSWYPIKQELPRVSMGLMSRNRDNGIDRFNPFISPSLEDAAVRNYIVVDGQNEIGPNARSSNTTQFTTSVSQQFDWLGITHDASINYSLLNTKDDVFRYGDATSNNISFNVTNRWKTLPLDTRIGFSVNSTETGGGLNDISIFGFNIGGSMFFMDDKLNVNAAIAITSNKTEIVPLETNDNGTPNDVNDDFFEPNFSNSTDSKTNSFIFNTGGRYTLNQNHSFLLSIRFTNVSSPLSSIQTNNDRIIQARYVFNF